MDAEKLRQRCLDPDAEAPGRGEVLALLDENQCSTCCGTPHASGEVCVCGGANTARAEVDGLREALVRLRVENQLIISRVGESFHYDIAEVMSGTKEHKMRAEMERLKHIEEAARAECRSLRDALATEREEHATTKAERNALGLKKVDVDEIRCHLEALKASEEAKAEGVEEARAQAAALTDALTNIREISRDRALFVSQGPRGWLRAEAIADAALASDAGKGWLSPAQAEELRNRLENASGHEAAAEKDAEELRAQAAAMREALEHLRATASLSREASRAELFVAMEHATAALAPVAGRALLASHASAIAALTAERDAAMQELARYKESVTQKLQYEMKAVLDGTPERAMRIELQAMLAERDALQAALVVERAKSGDGPFHEVIETQRAKVDALRERCADHETNRTRDLSAFAECIKERDALKADNQLQAEALDDAREEWPKLKAEIAALRAAWRTVNAPEKHAGENWMFGVVGCRFRPCGMSRAGIVCAWHVCTCGEHARRAEARKLLYGSEQ